MTAEEEVRAAWEETILGGLYLYESARSYHLRLGEWKHKGNVKDKESVWQAALDYTRKRQQEIAEIEEEIRTLKWVRDNSMSFLICLPIAAISRILSRLTAQRDELKKGMI